VLGFQLPTGVSISSDGGFNPNAVSAVPEPGTLLLLVIGAVALGAVARRRQTAPGVTTFPC
jgi:hypothetical protein